MTKRMTRKRKQLNPERNRKEIINCLTSYSVSL